MGSNLEDSMAHLRGALAELDAAPGVSVVSFSSPYRTAPVGYADQPDFLNVTVAADTTLSGEDLLALAHEVEAAHHRRRLFVNGPRTLDVDIVTLAGETRGAPGDDLVLPHPRAHERAFVLVPWLEIDPDAVLPGHGPVRDLVAGLDTSGVERLEWPS